MQNAIDKCDNQVQNVQEAVADGTDVDIVDSEIIDKLSDNILSLLTQQKLVVDEKTKENLGETTSSTDSVPCEKKCVDDGSSLVGQLHLEPSGTVDVKKTSLLCKTSDHILSMNQPDSLVEDKLLNNSTEKQTDSDHLSVSNTDIQLSFSSSHTANSDSILPKNLVDQMLLKSKMANCSQVQNETNCSENKSSLTADLDNSSGMMNKLLQVLNKEPNISNENVDQTKSDTSTGLEHKQLDCEYDKSTVETIIVSENHCLQPDTEMTKSGLSEDSQNLLMNVQFDCRKDSSEGFNKKGEERPPEDSAVDRSDAKQIKDKMNTQNFHYVFLAKHFAHENVSTMCI